MGDTISFPANTVSSAVVFMYAGTWDFIKGVQGDYANENAQLGGINGQSYDGAWTEPVEFVAGDLQIAWTSESQIGMALPKPGEGFSVEFNNALPNQVAFAVEDKITPVDGVYIGSLTWKDATGGDTGGGHWLMGLAGYRRTQ